jgi:uncharacterized protein
MNKLQIKQVLVEQTAEINRLLKTRPIHREKEVEILRSLSNDLIKVIIGVRRSGKSFLSHLVLKNKDYGYVNFDDERFFGATTENLNDFLEAIIEIHPKAKYLLLDEIQNIQGWELFANRLKRTGYRVIVTGSNAKLLSRELATHLTGRHLSFELFPFSFREFLTGKNITVPKNRIYATADRASIKKALEEYMEQGGFPELLFIDDKKLYLRELYDKIITRDILPRHKIKFGKELRELATYLYSNFGSRFTYKKLKDVFEIKSIHTIKNYLDYLGEAYLVFELVQFSFKLKQQIRSAKKIYCIDTGLINSISFQNSKNIGHLLENLVFLNLKAKGKEIYFYTDRTGGEVDFVIREYQKISELVQVCYDPKNLETGEREVSSLVNSSKELKCDKLTIITWDEERTEIIKKKQVRYVPLWKWLLDN